MIPGRLAALFLVATALVFYLGCLCISIPHAVVLVSAFFLAWRPTSRIALGGALVVALVVIVVGLVGLVAAIAGGSSAWMMTVSAATLVFGFGVSVLAPRGMFWTSKPTGRIGG